MLPKRRKRGSDELDAPCSSRASLFCYTIRVRALRRRLLKIFVWGAYYWGHLDLGPLASGVGPLHRLATSPCSFTNAQTDTSCLLPLCRHGDEERKRTRRLAGRLAQGEGREGEAIDHEAVQLHVAERGDQRCREGRQRVDRRRVDRRRVDRRIFFLAVRAENGARDGEVDARAGRPERVRASDVRMTRPWRRKARPGVRRTHIAGHTKGSNCAESPAPSTTTVWPARIFFEGGPLLPFYFLFTVY